MQLISAQTLTSASSTVTFSSIPQTFTDLQLVISTRTTGSADPSIRIRINGDSGANYSYIALYGNGVSPGSFTQAAPSSGNTFLNAGYSVNSTSGSNIFSNNYIYFTNYASSNKKSWTVDSVNENNGTDVLDSFFGGLWNSTSPINSLVLSQQTDNYAAGSSFYLYGVSSDTVNQNTDGPYAFGGDSIIQSGGYWIHTFLNSNSFTPQKNLTADILVVAGGGGGGSIGGGGGAGGLQGLTSQSLTSNNIYPVVIGSGGVGAVVSGNTTVSFSGKGSNSSFGSLTASVGGGAGGNYDGPGSTGGSGGGATYYTNVTLGVGGGYAGTSGQGNSGGSNASGDAFSNGGGGGAGAVGGNGKAGATAGGSGGVGSSAYSSWGSATSTGELVSSTYYYAGGGGGGSWQGNSGSPGVGGSGGGGAGSGSNASATSGTANTGGGGGGGGFTNNPTYIRGNGGAGGSGIVIVRYAV